MLPLLLSFSALAADDTTVLVSSLQPRNPESVGLASLVENFLAQELAKHPGIDVLRVEQTPAFEDYSARTYMEGCPSGEIVGCTYIIAERGGARLAITGTVKALVGSTKVEIDILDIEGARTLVSFQSELESGNDEAFAEGVAKVLVAAIDGEIGKEKDIRFEEGEEEPEPTDDAAVARELEALQREMGSVSTMISRSNKVIQRPEYTVADLAKKMGGEAATPWERLGMKPAEYLRYKNSGLNLVEWRERAMGRQGQLLIRPTVGFSSGPYSGTYYGRLAYDVVGGSLNVVDAYAAQVVQTGSGGTVGASVAYGLTPAVDVGLVGGLTLGQWTVDINQETVGQPAKSPQPTTTVQTTIWGGPRATVTLLPVHPIRPSFGASVLFLHGRNVMDPETVPESLSLFTPPTLVAGELFVGGEARISKTVDFFLQVPLQMRLAGKVSATDRVGTAEVVEPVPPAEAGVIGAGVYAGLQIRLFGTKPKETTRFDEIEEEPEE